MRALSCWNPELDNLANPFGAEQRKRVAEARASEAGFVKRTEDGVTVTDFDPDRAPRMKELLRAQKKSADPA